MDFFTWIFVGSILLSVLGGIFWLVFYVFLAKKLVESTNHSQVTNLTRFGMGAGEQDFMQLLKQLEDMMHQYNDGTLSRLQVAQMNKLLSQTQNQFHQMDQISQQRYDTKISGMMGYAASNGLDWNPYS